MLYLCKFKILRVESYHCALGKETPPTKKPMANNCGRNLFDGKIDAQTARSRTRQEMGKNGFYTRLKMKTLDWNNS